MTACGETAPDSTKLLQEKTNNLQSGESLTDLEKLRRFFFSHQQEDEKYI